MSISIIYKFSIISRLLYIEQMNTEKVSFWRFHFFAILISYRIYDNMRYKIKCAFEFFLFSCFFFIFIKLKSWKEICEVKIFFKSWQEKNRSKNLKLYQHCKWREWLCGHPSFWPHNINFINVNSINCSFAVIFVCDKWQRKGFGLENRLNYYIIIIEFCIYAV